MDGVGFGVVEKEGGSVWWLGWAGMCEWVGMGWDGSTLVRLS